MLLLTQLVCWTVFGIAVTLLSRMQDGPISYELGGWPSPYGIVYTVDYLSSFVMLFVSGLGAIVITYAPQSIKKEVHQSKHTLFYASYLLCICI